MKIILDFIIPYHFLISQPLTLWVTKLRQFIQRGSKGATGFLDTFLCNNLWFGSENVQSEKAKRKQAWIRTSAAVWRDSRARWEIVSKRFWGRLMLLCSFFFFGCFATCFRALLKIKNWNRTNDDLRFFEFQRPKYIASFQTESKSHWTIEKPRKHVSIWRSLNLSDLERNRMKFKNLSKKIKRDKQKAGWWIQVQ